MKTFLQCVAADLIQRFGSDMREVTVVFPGKRASLFLNQELARQSNSPVWAPRYLTLGDLFLKLTDKQKSEPIDNVCTLYQIFLQVMGPEETETLDQFYSWGEIILQDFDDIDKHLADAKSLFSNIKDLEELSQDDIITEEQHKVLSRFFHNFTTDDAQGVRERFLHIWNHMYELYTLLRKNLAERGLGYEGMIYREVAEKLKANVMDEQTLSILRSFKTTAFAGFNVLNTVEEVLMEALKNQGQALFYWDYDIYYTKVNKNNEAGAFMVNNLNRFPSALGEEEFDNFSQLQDVTLITTTSDNIQARYVYDWMHQPHNEQDNRNAIVLCNEGLLQPVLHSLPQKDDSCAPKSVNITMGFPLTDAPIFNFIGVLTSLQVEGYNPAQQRFLPSYRRTVQNHPYFSMVDEEVCFTYCGDSASKMLIWLRTLNEQVGRYYSTLSHPGVYEQLYIEAIFQTSLILQQFIELTTRTDNPLAVSPLTVRRLMRQLMATRNIPFHGEPANGLQIMGVLETRCLDFSHLLMLSLEEGNLPKGSHQNSLIPANLRTAFHLTTIKHKIAVYAYYFYRLVQRTEHLTCVYSENCVGTSKHEISRFLRQLLAETQIPVRTLSIQNQPLISEIKPLVAAKTPQVMERLRQMYLVPDERGYTHQISPSAINTYLTCPMKFYFRYVVGLAEQEEEEDGMKATQMGTIFHLAMQLMYNYLIQREQSKTLQPEVLSTLLEQAKVNQGGTEHARHPQFCLVDASLDAAFDILHFHKVDNEKLQAEMGLDMLQKDAVPDNMYTGELIIIRDVLRQYMCNQLTYDAQLAPFTILKLEGYCSVDVPIDTPWGKQTLRTGGIIDRMDQKGNTVRIVDYKTGSPQKDDFSTWDQILGSGDKHNGYYFQTFVYALAQAFHPDYQDVEIKPVLMYPAALGTPKFHDVLKLKEDKNNIKEITNFAEHAEQFIEGLKEILTRLFNTTEEICFCQNDTDIPCANCDFKSLCNKI